MCHCHHNQNPTITVETTNPTADFWDIGIGDAANVATAVISLLLAFYIFVYQRRKDNKDQLSIINQIKSSTKLEMFKLLIIEPHVDTIHVFFRSISKEYQRLNGIQVSHDLKTEISAKLDVEFNQFESDVIESFKGIDAAFYNKMLGLLDAVRDGISAEIDGAPINDIGEVIKIDSLFTDFKAEFISALYNFHCYEE